AVAEGEGLGWRRRQPRALGPPSAARREGRPGLSPAAVGAGASSRWTSDPARPCARAPPESTRTGREAFDMLPPLPWDSGPRGVGFLRARSRGSGRRLLRERRRVYG